MMIREMRKTLAVAAACLVGTLTGCNENRQTSPQVSTAPTVLHGGFQVYYDLQTSETGGTSTDTPDKVKAIHFHDQYIVIEREGHGGRVIPIRQIKHFRWD